MAEKKVITKKDWMANFSLTGTPKINADYTFKIDERSDKSNWIYNSMNLGIDCGEKHGVIYAECMGGYSADNGKENKIFAHGKKSDGSDDFETQVIVDWSDRFNDSVLEEIGDLSFITVGLEMTDKKKVYYKKFLSSYDAIAYIREHLTDDMVVTVRGNLKYSTYNDTVQVRKNITYIGLAIDSKTKEPVAPDKFKATFTQTVLLDKDSASLKDIDKDKSVMYVNTRVLDYVKEINGIEVKGQYPFNKRFEFPLDLSNEKLCKTVLEKLFRVKKDITQVTFEGEFIEGGAVVKPTWEDVPKEIQELVEIGVYTEEEALTKCASNGNRERRMVLKKPLIKLVGDDKVPVVQKFEGRYTEDDLELDYLWTNVADDVDDEVPFEEESNDDDSMSWLNSL